MAIKLHADWMAVFWGKVHIVLINNHKSSGGSAIEDAYFSISPYCFSVIELCFDNGCANGSHYASYAIIFRAYDFDHGHQ